MTLEPPKIIHLDQIEPVPGPSSLTRRPVKWSLGVRRSAAWARDDEDFASLRDDAEFRSVAALP